MQCTLSLKIYILKSVSIMSLIFKEHIKYKANGATSRQIHIKERNLILPYIIGMVHISGILPPPIIGVSKELTANLSDKSRLYSI